MRAWSDLNAYKRPSVKRAVSVIVVLQMACALADPATQAGDVAKKLIVDELIFAAVQQHPTVRVEYSQGMVAQADLDAAKLRRYPSISIQSESAPVAASATSSVGAVKTFTAEQVIWSAGRERSLVDSAQSTLELHEAQLLETKYQVAMRVIDAWQGVLQGTFRIKEIVLTQQKLEDFLAFMKRRVEVGVSPKIEIELISSRIAQSRVDLQQARSSYLTAKAKLQVLLDRNFTVGQLVGSLSLQEQVRIATDMHAELSLDRLPNIIDTHPSVRKARFQAQAARFELSAQRAAQWPQVYLRYQKTFNESAGFNSDGLYVGLKYQPGAGFSSLALVKSAQARVDGLEQSVDVVRHDLQDIVDADIQDLDAARGRAEALAQAVEANGLLQESYERQFVVGRRNWQDVMNAVRESKDARVSLVDARCAILSATYRLRTRMGELEWQKKAPRVITQ